VPGVEVPASGDVDLGRVELVAGAPLAGRVVDSRGLPVAGAEVFALGPDEARVPRLRYLAGVEPAATTSADGAFLVADRRPGERLDVAARRTGYIEGRAAGVVVPNVEPVVVALREASDIRGRVVDERGEPVGGAQVFCTIERDVGGYGFSATSGPVSTADDGRFEIGDVEPGTVRLRARTAGHLPLERGGFEVPAGRDLEGVELVLRAAAVVEGVVTAADGRPVIGASVGIVVGDDERDRWAVSAETDGDGRYRLPGIEPGRSTLAATHEEHERAVGELEVAAGTNRLDLRMGAGHEVSGSVTAGGVPLAGATVWLAPPGGRFTWPRRSATTDAAGTFRIEGVPDGGYDLIAEHRGHGPAEQPVTVAGAAVGGLAVDLPPGYAIVGALRGVAAAELALVSVVAVAEGAHRVGEVSGDGRYRIEGVAAGGWWVAADVADSGRQARARAEVTGAGETTVDLDFTGGLALTGTVRHEGRPVSGARVWLRPIDALASGSATTDYQGRYRIENLAAGSYRLEVLDAQRGGRHGAEVTLDGDRELDVELRSFRLTGRVLDAFGDEPIAGARVEVEPAVDEAMMWGYESVETDDSGGFTVSSLAEGQWRLVAQKGGYARAETLVELAGESLDGIELRLQPAQGVTLRVTRALGAPPGSVHVAVIDPASQQPVSTGAYETGEAGTVRISTVPAGSWEAVVRADGSAIVRFPVLSPGPTVDVGLAPAATLEVSVPELAESDTIATLTVRGADGKPLLAPRWDRIEDEYRVWQAKTTVRDLPAGTWTLEVTAPDGRRWTGSATTAPGVTTAVELR
jgi:hypothetical protein